MHIWNTGRIEFTAGVCVCSTSVVIKPITFFEYFRTVIDNLVDIWLIGKFGSTVSQCVCVCWIMNWLLLDFILGLEPLAKKKGIEEKRGATESGGVGHNSPEDTVAWRLAQQPLACNERRQKKESQSPVSTYSTFQLRHRTERRALVCVCACACGSWDLLVTSGGPTAREPNNINWDYQRPKRVLVMVRERDWHRQTQTQKRNKPYY